MLNVLGEEDKDLMKRQGTVGNFKFERLFLIILLNMVLY